MAVYTENSLLGEKIAVFLTQLNTSFNAKDILPVFRDSCRETVRYVERRYVGCPTANAVRGELLESVVNACDHV